MSMSTQLVSTKQLETNTLTMGNVTATGIARELKEANATDLVLVGSIEKLLLQIGDLYDKLSPNSTFLEEITVMTPSLVDKYFSRDDDWQLVAWGLTTDGAKCQGESVNRLTVNPKVYPKAGKGSYYVTMFIDSLPSGCIDVYVDKKWVRSLNTTGRHAFELTLDTAHANMSFTYRDGAKHDQVVIKELAVHHITTTFVNYLTAKIRQLATISAEDYVRKDELEHRLSEIQQQLNALLKNMGEVLTEHMHAHNPHEITCEMINAAPANHTHDDYITSTSFTDKVEQVCDTRYSKVNHKHDEYVTNEELKDKVGDLVSGSLADVTTLTPVTIISAPTGKLPQRYVDSGIDTAAQIIQSPGIHLHADVPYDAALGMVDTNIVDLIDEAPKFFSDTKNYVHFSTEVKNTSFRITFHKTRKILGYTLKYKDGSSIPKEWIVCSDDTSFIHRALPSKIVFKDNAYTVNFDAAVEVDSLTFSFSAFDDNADKAADLKVELITENMSDVLEITSKEFTVCLPNSGANRVAKVNASVAKTTPDTKIPGTNYYLFARKTDFDSNTVLYWSAYPPICSDKHTGTDVLTDVYHIGATAIRTDTSESYAHTEYGTLVLRQGKTVKGSLVNIYGSQGDTWTSEGEEVIIEHTFPTDDVIMTGYLLAWHNQVEDIPQAWTLTLSGYDHEDKPITIIIDSVKEYYPFYSVMDDDLVYYKQFDTYIRVKSLSLSFKARDAKTARITLSRVSWFLSQYWYSPASNSAYLGLKPTTAACVGSVYCNPELQWEINNTYAGKCCTVPVNNLAICSVGLHTIPNPYHTDSVTCIVRAHDFINNSMASGVYITSLTAEYITVYCALPVRCSVQILRVW